MSRRLSVVSALAVVLSISLAGAEEVPAPLKQRTAGSLGPVLTGPSGMTLYTYAHDKDSTRSTCSGACAENWPPFKPAPNAPPPTAPLSLVTRDDGTKQYAWKGKPLYYWKNDRKVGETGGHNFRDVWSVAQP